LAGMGGMASGATSVPASGAGGGIYGAAGGGGYGMHQVPLAQQQMGMMRPGMAPPQQQQMQQQQQQQMAMYGGYGPGMGGMAAVGMGSPMQAGAAMGGYMHGAPAPMAAQPPMHMPSGGMSARGPGGAVMLQPRPLLVGQMPLAQHGGMVAQRPMGYPQGGMVPHQGMLQLAGPGGGVGPVQAAGGPPRGMAPPVMGSPPGAAPVNGGMRSGSPYRMPAQVLMPGGGYPSPPRPGFGVPR